MPISPNAKGNYPPVIPWEKAASSPRPWLYCQRGRPGPAPRKTTTSMILLWDYNGGVKGSCQSWDVRPTRGGGPWMRPFNRVGQTSELVQSGEKIASGHFSFETFCGKNMPRRHSLKLENQRGDSARQWDRHEGKTKTRPSSSDVTDVQRLTMEAHEWVYWCLRLIFTQTKWCRQLPAVTQVVPETLTDISEGNKQKLLTYLLELLFKNCSQTCTWGPDIFP